MKLITWNMAHRGEAWKYLLDSDADFALLQEAAKPPDEIANKLEVDTAPWKTGGADTNRAWRTAVVNLSNMFNAQWFQPKSVDDASVGELAVSRLGTLAAASISLTPDEELIVISAYGLWETPHGTTGSGWIYADASVHRLISDLSALIGQQTGHRIIVAGDMNILFGYGENGSSYWASRYQTVFDRMSALGLDFIGPQAPAGRLAEPWPSELPSTSKNVPTFHHSRQSPTTATRQLDFVFASSNLSERIQVKALNDLDNWGPSDHCQVEIVIN